GGRPDVDRHDQGRRARRVHRDGAPAREVGGPLRDLEAQGLKFRAHVITVSDRVSAGRMEDASGPALFEMLGAADYEVSGPEVVPDNQERVTDCIVAAVVAGADL